MLALVSWSSLALGVASALIILVEVLRGCRRLRPGCTVTARPSGAGHGAVMSCAIMVRACQEPLP